MAVQHSTLAQLSNASKEMIKEAIYTMEHETPNRALVRSFTLQEGHDTMVIPKVGQMTFLAINESQKNTNEMDIGMTTSSVSTSIVGGKVILTDTLLRDNSLDIWQIVGKQVGDAGARKIDRDIIALYPSLNGGTTLGAAAAVFSIDNVLAVIAHAKTNKFGSGMHIICHPNQLARLSKDLSAVNSGRPIPRGYSEDRLANFFTGIVLGAVPFFETGNIDLDTNNDAIGCIKAKDTLGVLQAGSVRSRRERDESIGEGAWILYVTHRYTAFERDDATGAPLTYASATKATS